MKTLRRVWAVACLAACLGVSGAARADILPPPTRPGWQEHPAPEPDVPDALAWAIGGLSVLAVGGALIAYAKRKRDASEHAPA